MLCGSGGETNASGCHADSGGPYVCEIDGRWELHGIASWADSRCNIASFYTGFARVNYYRDWIIRESRKIQRN